MFDHARAELIDLKEFGSNSKLELAAYSRIQREHLNSGDDIEIVLIGSDSLDTIEVTHANYFDGTIAVSKYFAGI